MKKLIAISVVFALVAGAVFAADIAVDVKGGVNLIKGDTGKKKGNDAMGNSTTVATKPTADGGMGQFRISASGENDDGTFGAFFRWDAGWGWSKEVGSAQGHAWWKPVDALKLLIGGGPDGRFDKPGVSGWNFYQIAGDVGVAKENWKFSSFYGGWSDAGVDLIITPIEPLEINFAVPFMTRGWDRVENVYMKSAIQVAYNIENIGSFAITYQSGVGNKTEETGLYKLDTDTGKWKAESKEIHDPGQLWLYFNLSAVENLSIDIGFGYQLPASGKELQYRYWNSTEEKDSDLPKFDGSINSPIAAGVAAKFDAGDFGVKARLQGKLAGKVTKDAKINTTTGEITEKGETNNIPLNVVFDVMPYYAVSEALTFHFSVGVEYTAASTNERDKVVDSVTGLKSVETGYTHIGFHVNPYITIKSSWWAPNFYAGIHIGTDGSKTNYSAPVAGVPAPLEKNGITKINWSVPIGIAYSF